MTNSESVVRGVCRYAENVGDMIKTIQKSIEGQYTRDTLTKLGRVFIVGTGVNYAAALAAKSFFQVLTGWTGEWINVVPAATYASLMEKEVLKAGDSHVICLDAQGDIGSTLNAVKTAHQYGAHVTCISLHADSPLAASCDTVICPPEAVENTFGGFGEYFLTLLSLMLFALATGEARELVTREEADGLRLQIAEYAESFCSQIGRLDETAKNLAEGWKNIKNYEMVGTGPDYASAWLARLIAYKELGTLTTVEESEDWLHVNMLQVEPEAFGCMLFVSDGNPSKDRTLRTVRFIKGLGRNTIAVTDTDGKEFPKGVDIIQIPSAGKDWMKPLLSFVPAALLLAHLKDQIA